MASRSLIEEFLVHCGLALGGLREFTSPKRAAAWLRRLGHNVPAATLGASSSKLAQAGVSLSALACDIGVGTGGANLSGKLADLVSLMKGVIESLTEMRDRISAGGGTIAGGPGEFAQGVLGLLVIDYLQRRRPDLFRTLRVVGVIDESSDGESDRIPRLRLDRLLQLLTRPDQLGRDVYGWGVGFEADELLERVQGLMRAQGLPGGIYSQSPATQGLLGNSSPFTELRWPLFHRGGSAEDYQEFGVTISPVEASGSQAAGVALLFYLHGAEAFAFSVCQAGELLFESSASANDLGVVLRSPGVAVGVKATASPSHASVTMRQKPASAREMILAGSAGGTRLSVQGLGITWFLENAGRKVDLGCNVEIQALRFAVGGADGDGFLQKILTGLQLDAQTKLRLGLSYLSGATLEGSPRLSLQIPLHLQVGAISIERLSLTAAPENGRVSLHSTVLLRAALGPLTGVIEDFGLSTQVELRPGNLGPVNLNLAFRPPKGVGLSVDAGPVKGGGYLYFDSDKEEYAGALELVFSGFLSLKAIGLITTRMPDGSRGFSLLIIITAEFATGLQLGFGFTLLGVGGLIGLNRTMRLQPLADGIRSGAINGILFPRDVIENAPRIISDLREIFPPQEGRFLIGPMAKLGWGTPTLISLSLGIVIEIPGNIAILGVLRLAVPADDVAVIVLQVNFLGAIEFDKKRVWFFAALFDSRALTITLSGELGVLAAFGDDANLVLAVGGFHPQFHPPALPFPVPRRLCVNLIDTALARIRLDGYFALTTNSLQFGAHADASFGFDDFGVEGHLAFDTLIVFSPLHFSIAGSSSFSLKLFGEGVYGISISFLLEGPTPWRVRGTGTYSILFIDIDVDFDFTWGDRIETALPPINAFPLVLAALREPRNWRTRSLGRADEAVTVRPLSEDEAARVLQPSGTIEVRQKTAPLEVSISKVGNQRIADVTRVGIRSSSLEILQRVTDQFAAAQYNDLDDAARLSRPSYEYEQSGVELSTGKQGLFVPAFVKRSMRYEVTIIDHRYLSERKRFQTLSAGLFNHWLQGNSAAKHSLSRSQAQAMQPFAKTIRVDPERYAVVFTQDNRSVEMDRTFGSESQARDFMRSFLANRGGRPPQVQVVPEFEVSH